MLQTDQLMSFTGFRFPVEYASKAIEMSGGDINRAFQLLEEGDAEAFVKGSKENGGGEGADDMWQQAHHVAMISNMPPQLCFRALEMFNGRVEVATNWARGAWWRSIAWRGARSVLSLYGAAHVCSRRNV